ncbi:MAG: hypothetical protein WC575_03665 [Patescibacteria group bacterium]
MTEITELLVDLDEYTAKSIVVECPFDHIALVPYQDRLRCNQCAFMIEFIQNGKELINEFCFSETFWWFLNAANQYMENNKNKDLLLLRLKAWGKALSAFNSINVKVCRVCWLMPETCTSSLCKGRPLIILQPYEVAACRVPSYWRNQLMGVKRYI